MPRLLIATHNRGKVKEYAEMMSGLSVEPISLDEAGITTDVEETGDAFEENARIKALAYARLSGLLTLADDSGLEVDALGGAPGVQSARYAGPGASDADRYRLLLENLEGIPPNRRTARFRCVLALATPQGEVRVVHGTVEGVIADGPRGSHGFGYDPVFYMPEHGATMAELGPEIKNTISHRARAFQAILPILRALIDP
jgi:XTP/dITP diphosphohydrolase